MATTKSAQKGATNKKTVTQSKGSAKQEAGKAAVVNKNLEQAAAKAGKDRESKYNYPANLDAKGKKEFRRTARATAAKYEKELKALKKTDKAAFDKMTKEMAKWEKETYVKTAA